MEKYGPVYRSQNKDIVLINCDCMDFMRDQADKAFDLAIVDPPYGVNLDKGMDRGKDRSVGFNGRGNPIARKTYIGDWDTQRPSAEYFIALMRVSILQIIWGANFYSDLLPASGHWIFWDKKNTMPSFGDGELAWTSSNRKSVKKYELEYNGLLGKEITRVHATQKPVKLYQWLLTNYAKPGQRILDTHLGSGSSAIAAHYFGVDFVGCERDKHYFDLAVQRFDQETRQIDMLGQQP